MTYGERLDWIGEFATSVLILGAVGVLFVLTNPGHHHVIALPLAWRVVIMLLFVVAIVASRMWFRRWRERCRARPV